jgi:hypothetical protein
MDTRCCIISEKINKANGTWKAEAYDFYNGLKIEDLNRLAGRNKSYTINGKVAVLD